MTRGINLVLDDEENKMVEVYKATQGYRNKRKAIKELIRLGYKSKHRETKNAV